MHPSVSVVMAVYNGERFLEEAVESVLRDDLDALELVAIDDGSTDSSPQILADLQRGDARVRVFREPAPTLAAALNRGVRHSRGELIARLDADDVSLPGRLRAQREFLRNHPEVVLVGGQVQLVDEAGHAFGSTDYPLDDPGLRAALQSGNPFVHSAVTMTRAAFEAAGGYRESLPHAEDLDLWLRLAERGRLANLPQAVASYRIHGSQVSLRNQETQAVHAEAARLSARARRDGQPDPLDGAGAIDAEFLAARGVDRAEIARAVVEAAMWLGRTCGRAGYREAERKLFAGAYERARARYGSPALAAAVRRSMAQRHAEQGHMLRAKAGYLRARLEERR